MPPRRRRTAEGPGSPHLGELLPLEQKLELYYWMRLTRTLEERLVALYRQTKVVGGLFRSLGQEADAVGSCSSRSVSRKRHCLVTMLCSAVG